MTEEIEAVVIGSGFAGVSSRQQSELVSTSAAGPPRCVCVQATHGA
ncbi:hypothetical protein [Streptomyces sp. NPDC048521]